MSIVFLCLLCEMLLPVSCRPSGESAHHVKSCLNVEFHAVLPVHPPQHGHLVAGGNTTYISSRGDRGVAFRVAATDIRTRVAQIQ